MKSFLRALLRRYLASCPVTEGKRFFYRMLSEALLPAESEAVVRLRPGFYLGLDLSETTQREIFYFGVYERKESALIQKLLKPGDVFWDIGANIGYFTLMSAACVGPNGRVAAFEPFPAAWQHSPCEVALLFGQGGIASLPRDYKGGRSSPLSDSWARSDHQHRWRSPALWAGRVTCNETFCSMISPRSPASTVRSVALLELPTSFSSGMCLMGWPV